MRVTLATLELASGSLGYRRIVVFPYFLFTGILVKRIYDYTDAVAARHPEIEFVKAGYRAACSSPGSTSGKVTPE